MWLNITGMELLEMKHWRNLFLKSNNIDAYRKVQEFFLGPNKEKVEDIVRFFPINEQDNARHLLLELVEQYRKDRKKYNRTVINGQAIIWDEVLRCYLDICDLTNRFDQHSCLIYKDNYIKSAAELEAVCDLCAKMLARVSSLEEVLGVDRFLDRVSEDTFLVIDEIICEYKHKLNILTWNHKFQFQECWNTASVSNVIYHKLLNQANNDPICDLFRSGQKHIILFIIDGFGFCQYLWHCHLDDEEKSYTYNENLFKWLQEAGCMRCFPIGSSFITDTGAGLAQIFTGQDSKRTGVIASKYSKPESGRQVLETKRIPIATFQNTFETQWNSIFDVLSPYGISTKVYYCSRYPNTTSGFSKFIFGGGKVEEVTPSERLFSYLKGDIDNGFFEGLQVVYNTGIDNSGHTMGAYSKFEKYEHDKLDGLIRNFLIELAETTPELFDGNRSIMITADHGMAESAKLMFDRQTLKNVLLNKGISNPILIEDNRALLIYSIGNNQIIQAKEALVEYFESVNTDVDVISSMDSSFEKFFNTNPNEKQSKIVPQLIIRLIGNGLFYSNTNINSHLLHYGGHGGASTDEVFVPLIDIPLDNQLLTKLKSRFVDL